MSLPMGSSSYLARFYPYNHHVAALGEPLLMTVEQFHALPEQNTVLEELHFGHLVTLSRPKPWHIKLQMRLADLLRTYVGDRGYAITELPFRAVPQYDLRAADGGIVSRDRWDAVGDGDLIGPPELVIEVLSPSNTKAQIREYAALCLANGCQEFWTVDRDSQTIVVAHKQGHSIAYDRSSELPLRVLCEATLPVNRIFD